MAELARIGIAIAEDLLKEFADLIARRRYTNRSEAFRDLVRREFGDEISGSTGGEVFGISITIELVRVTEARLSGLDGGPGSDYQIA